MFDDFDFRDHPDTVTIEIAGQEVPFFLGRKSFALAKEEGVDVGEVMQEVESTSEADFIANIDAFASLLWVGLLVFDDISVSRTQLADVLSMQDMQRLQSTIVQAFGEVVDDEVIDQDTDAVGKQ